MGDATGLFTRRGVARGGLERGLSGVIRLNLELFAGDDIDLLLIDGLPVGISQFDGVGAGT